MKHLMYMWCLLNVALLQAQLPDADDFQLIIEPKWQNLEMDSTQSDKFGGKWLLVGSITFRKKAKESVNLTQLELRWNGQEINDLLGSLYRKDPDKDFLPIEDNLVCDGTWNKTRQLLKLTFDEKETLGLVNIFYLVLTIPETMEPLVKKGSFEIVQRSLPEPFRLATLSHKLSLSLDIIGSSIESD